MALPKIIVDNTHFNYCGNEKLVGGALFFKNINFKVKNADIFNCKALVSGGVYTSNIYQDSFEIVHFKDCYSYLYQDLNSFKKQNDINQNGSGIYSENIEDGSSDRNFVRCIRNTVFENSNLFIATKTYGKVFEKCKFKDSILGLEDYYDQDEEMGPCEFITLNTELESGFKYLPNFKCDPLHIKQLESQLSDLPKNQLFDG